MTKQIQLTQGKVAIIDDEDFALVSKYKWCACKNRSTYYARAWMSERQGIVGMHTLILQNWGTITDHADGDGLNNTRLNIRSCTNQQNQFNKTSKGNLDKQSAYKGVCSHGKMWRSQIQVNNVKKYIGVFKTETEAARAYDKAAKELFGEFARLNFPEGQTQ